MPRDDIEGQRRPSSGARSRVGVPAKVCVCGIAAALSLDSVVANLVNAGPLFRAPSVFLGILATLLAVPLLPSLPRLGSRLAPVLCFAGSLLAGWVTLLLLVLAREARWNPDHMTDRPFKLLVMAVLFSLTARDPRWRARMVASYMVGWGAFVVYGLFALATGRALVSEYSDLTRTTLAALGPRENEQAVLIATGMVMMLVATLRATGAAAVLRAGVLVASTLAFVSSASRAGSLALAAGSAVVLYGWVRDADGRPFGRALKAGVVLAILAVGATLVVGHDAASRAAVSTLQRRFAATTTQGDFGRRDELAARTVRLALHNPLQGVGLERTRDALGGDPHNGYLKIVAEGGIFAAMLLATGLLLTGAAIVRSSRRGAALGPVAALVVVMTAAAAGQELMRGRFWFFLALVAAGAARDAERPA